MYNGNTAKKSTTQCVVVPGCAACLRTVMCGCSVGVKVGNKTAFYFPPKTNKCHKNSTIWAHIANLAVLTAFFKSEDLGSLAGASVVEIGRASCRERV